MAIATARSRFLAHEPIEILLSIAAAPGGQAAPTPYVQYRNNVMNFTVAADREKFLGLYGQWLFDFIDDPPNEDGRQDEEVKEFVNKVLEVDPGDMHLQVWVVLSFAQYSRSRGSLTGGFKAEFVDFCNGMRSHAKSGKVPTDDRLFKWLDDVVEICESVESSSADELKGEYCIGYN